MWPIFFIVIFALGAGLALGIAVRHFPQVANLDIGSLPEEQAAHKKREILARRVEAEGSRWLMWLQTKLKPVLRWWGKVQLRFRVYVGKVERLWHHEERLKRKQTVVATPEDAADKVAALIAEAEGHLQRGEHDKAEQLFLAAIKFDHRSLPAYRGLADTYFAQGALEEAQETYKFVLRFNPNDDAVMAKIAEIAESRGDLDTAIAAYQQAVVTNDSLSPRFYHLAELLLKVNQPKTAKEAIVSAVELEPKNPKYLDLLIETAILAGDKELAKQGFEELRLVNAKNQKLQAFSERIKEMGRD